jgi:transcriptional regulator with XRE-family HTH domain
MIGHMISKIRKEKGISKTQLASETDINIGHLTHIEKGERNPSHKALKEICYALNVPFQPFLYAYDQVLSKEQIDNKYLNYISYNKVPAISKVDEYIECPYDFAKASFAYKVPDDAMAPIIKKGSYAFVEVNGLIENKAIGLFKLNDEYIIRRLMYKKDKFILRADNKNVKDISVSSKDSFQILGRIYI